MNVWQMSAGHLYNSNKDDFSDIFKLLILSAYCNRNGVSTIKEDGTRYRVNQRNVFVFDDDSFERVKPLLTQEYYIPSIDGPFNGKIEFNLIRLTGGEFDS